MIYQLRDEYITGVGMLFSIIDPYIDLTIGFYGYFLAFAIGTVVGGYLFDKKYLSDGE